MPRLRHALMPRRQRRSPGWVIALATVLLALVLRLLGIRLGLPFFHHWDEVWVADNAKKMAQTEDWEPSTYQYGAPLSAIAAWLFHMLSELVPKWHIYDPGDGILMRRLCRLVTAVISSSGAAGVYVAAHGAAFGDRAGRIRGVYAAVLYATAAELVSHGRYGVTDADLVALVAWSLAACTLFLRSGSLLWAAATVALAGCAFAFKVTAITALAIPAIALTLRPVTIPRLPEPAAARIVALVALPSAFGLFLLLNPHVIIHWHRALGNIQARALQTIEGGFPLFLLRTPGWDHVESVLSGIVLMAFHRWTAPAVVAAVCAFAGLARALQARSGVCVVGAVQATVAILVIALTSRAYLFRNYLVALPVLCIGFGFAMEALTARWEKWANLRSRGLVARVPWLPVGFALVYVVVPAWQAVRTQQLSSDARMRAVDWIAAAAQAGGHEVSVACTPAILSQGTFTQDYLRGWLKRPGIAFAPDVKDAAEARRSHADYLVVVSSPDEAGDWGDMWPFREIPGYRVAATFEANPYEHRFDITSTWAGRFNVIVLERPGAEAPPHGA
jgi:4-amino-4-deoxy-L-arabinose transferase-like glycosyltransferase